MLKLNILFLCLLKKLAILAIAIEDSLKSDRLSILVLLLNELSKSSSSSSHKKGFLLMVFWASFSAR